MLQVVLLDLLVLDRDVRELDGVIGDDDLGSGAESDRAKRIIDGRAMVLRGADELRHPRGDVSTREVAGDDGARRLNIPRERMRGSIGEVERPVLAEHVEVP